MRDEESGSWWQQVTGQAIFGPLKGRQLEPVSYDETSFDLWKKEHPDGRVLLPDNSTDWKRFSDNWEEKTARYPVFTGSDTDAEIPPRTVIIGVKLDNVARAYALSFIEKQSPVLSSVGDVPIVLILGEDKKSVRAFERRVDGRELELFIKPGAAPLRFVDSESGSEWEFTGKAVSGPFAGRELKKVPILKDYWFDWKTYNPDTEIILK